MPEDPEKYDQLSRLEKRERLRTIAMGFAIIAPIAVFTVAIVLLYVDGERLGEAEEATVLSSAFLPDDGRPKKLVQIRLQDETLSTIILPFLATPRDGVKTCVFRMKKRLTGAIIFRPAPTTACEGP